LSVTFQIGEFAKANNTRLSVLAVEGQETGLQHVQQCAVVSGGAINVLNPLELMRQLRLIAQNYTIATAVDVVVILHPDLVFDEPGYEHVSSVYVEWLSGQRTDPLIRRSWVRSRGTPEIFPRYLISPT